MAAATTAAGVDHAYRAVRDAILAGRLRPGQLIPQVALAKSVSVSRTPLREALRLLQAEGLVEARPNQPMRVAPFSMAGIEELYAMRIPLELAALRISIPRLTDADLSEMESTLDTMFTHARARDFESWDGPHRRFHCLSTSRAGDRFSAEVSRLIDQCARFRRRYVRAMWTDQSQVEHVSILDACAARDIERATTLVGRHLGTTGLALLRSIEPNYAAPTLSGVLAGFDLGSTAEVVDAQ